jgi:hypothetical protein
MREERTVQARSILSPLSRNSFASDPGLGSNSPRAVGRGLLTRPTSGHEMSRAEPRSQQQADLFHQIGDVPTWLAALAVHAAAGNETWRHRTVPRLGIIPERAQGHTQL